MIDGEGTFLTQRVLPPGKSPRFLGPFLTLPFSYISYTSPVAVFPSSLTLSKTHMQTAWIKPVTGACFQPVAAAGNPPAEHGRRSAAPARPPAPEPTPAHTTAPRLNPLDRIPLIEPPSPLPRYLPTPSLPVQSVATRHL
jgi:hypothetical protein